MALYGQLGDLCDCCGYNHLTLNYDYLFWTMTRVLSALDNRFCAWISIIDHLKALKGRNLYYIHIELKIMLIYKLFRSSWLHNPTWLYLAMERTLFIITFSDVTQIQMGSLLSLVPLKFSCHHCFFLPPFPQTCLLGTDINLILNFVIFIPYVYISVKLLRNNVHC